MQRSLVSPYPGFLVAGSDEQNDLVTAAGCPDNLLPAQKAPAAVVFEKFWSAGRCKNRPDLRHNLAEREGEKASSRVLYLGDERSELRIAEPALPTLPASHHGPFERRAPHSSAEIRSEGADVASTLAELSSPAGIGLI